MDNWSRREFLSFLGRSAAYGAGSALAVSLPLRKVHGFLRHELSTPSFQPLRPTRQDDLILAPGFSYRVLAQQGDPISAKDRFGDCCDYTALLPVRSDLKTPSENEFLLWVNHEFVNTVVVSGKRIGRRNVRVPEEVFNEMREVGGSIVAVRRATDGQFNIVQDHPLNRRWDAYSQISLDREILGVRQVYGTFGNCAGGVTPWNTILTCEENYADFIGDISYVSKGKTTRQTRNPPLGWNQVLNVHPQHYGWVVEINPYTGETQKRTAMGRFAHECAKVVVHSSSGRCAVYSGDDTVGGCIYKFVAKRSGDLKDGQLYVANLETGRWILLDYEQQPILQKYFVDQTDVLIQARLASKIVGGTPCDRPEDIECDPNTGALYISLTNNYRTKKNYFGSILKIEEAEGNPLALEFESSTFLSGGTKSGFACPDNLQFDRKGNLWVTSDISGRKMNRGRYIPFGNNGLFYIPLTGKEAGQVFQVASAPVDAEFTGPSFSPDGKTLFLSVQHPGVRSKSPSHLSSHWPSGDQSQFPRSTVVTIQGPLFN